MRLISPLSKRSAVVLETRGVMAKGLAVVDLEEPNDCSPVLDFVVHSLVKLTLLVLNDNFFIISTDAFEI